MRRFTIAAVLLAALAGAAGAAAGAAVPISGTFTNVDPGTTTCDQTGPHNFHCTTTGIVTQYSGSLQGTSTLTVSGLINCQSNRTVGTGIETFTGSVNGVGSGTLTWHDAFNARFDCDTFAQFDTHGTATTQAGTGALAGLHGTYKFDDTTYEGTYH
jgi:hypothetical protein